LNVLEAKGIKKSFGGVKALVDGHITCAPGEIVGLLGANGSGKTTFSKIVMGLLNSDAGEIYVNGENVHFRTPMDAMRKGIIMVHQQLSLIPDLTVWENINIGHEPRTQMGFVDDEVSRRKAQAIIDKLCPGISLDREVRTLLPGDQQLIEIAKAISKDSQLLILDEPTAALEQTQVTRLFEILRELKHNGTSMIFISHRLGEVMEICDYVVVFRNGANVGTVEFQKDGKDEERIVSLMTGKVDLEQAGENGNRQISEAVRFEVKNLTSGNLKNIDFRVRKGEIVGIGGLQGQGQEELLLTLSGLLPLGTGQVFIDGQPMKLRHPADAIRSGMVLVPGDRQKEGLFLNHTVFMNMIYARFGLRGDTLIPFKKYKQQVREIIGKLSIKTDGIDTEMQALSGGNQQKVVVGKWLPLNPRVLLMSDPAKGVDVQAKKELYDVVNDLARQDTAVILYASDNQELISQCDRVFVMFEGEIVEELQNDSLNEEGLVSASLRANVKNNHPTQKEA
jgi:ribose transport system ATP-binding protein